MMEVDRGSYDAKNSLTHICAIVRWTSYGTCQKKKQITQAADLICVKLRDEGLTELIPAEKHTVRHTPTLSECACC